MARSRRDKRQESVRNTLFEKGISVTALGVVFLVGPAFLGSSPMLKVVGDGLRTPGWLALTAGLIMLGIHHVTKAKLPGKAAVVPTALTRRPTATELRNLREIVKDIPTAPRPTDAWHSVVEAPTPMRRNIMEPAAPATAKWSRAVFTAIEWRRFEAVCESLFAQAGFQTRSQSHGADGGVDIWLHSANAQGPVSVVQCKHWQSKPVGVKEMREFFGVMSSHQLKRGTYATTSTYTADAQQFAKANGIHTMDGPALLALISKRSPEQQQALLAVAFEGEYWRPTCASCGIKLVERKPAKGGAAFWGCSNYPKCKTTFKMTAPM